MPLKKAAPKPKDPKEDGGEKKAKKAEGGGDSTWVEPTTVVVKPAEQLMILSLLGGPWLFDSPATKPVFSFPRKNLPQ